MQAGLEAIGTPYAWGGDDASEGFDCSGLVLHVFREIAGLELPAPRASSAPRAKPSRTSRTCVPATWCSSPPGAEASPHVGIYIGQNKFVHAPRRGAKVRVDEMKNPY